jgi:hypothetical protein
MFDLYEDRDYEYNAREDYIRELQAEHDDPWWDIEPENFELTNVSLSSDFDPTPYQNFDEDISF